MDHPFDPTSLWDVVYLVFAALWGTLVVRALYSAWSEGIPEDENELPPWA